jgi:hypothetical protein
LYARIDAALATYIAPSQSGVATPVTYRGGAGLGVYF